MTDVSDCTPAGGLLKPFPAISDTQLEWVRGLDNGLETTFTWPRSHLSFNPVAFSRFLSLTHSDREEIFTPFFPICSLHVLSDLS